MTHAMNIPETWELFDQSDEQKVKEIRVEKISNAATFVILKEDHTVGNILQNQLLKNKRVIFAGYRVPHPLEPKLEIKIQTRDSSHTPRQAFMNSIDEVKNQLKGLRKQFQDQVQRFKKMQTSDAFYDEDEDEDEDEDDTRQDRMEDEGPGDWD